MPEVITNQANYLVVDGFINGNGVTRIKLTRTANLAATTPPPTEKSARLFIVDNTGQRYALTEKANGNYQSDSLQLAATRQYQLRITTASSATYESDLVPLKLTPPIDQLAWRVDGSQVQFLLSTHDPAAQSRYYRWRFTETWQFNSAFESFLEYRGGVIQYRITPIYTCWRTEQASTIKQGSTAQLSQDAVTNLSLLSLPTRAERFKVRYSLLVSQYAETAAEFAYLELLRKNTEAVGTVNDPLPSQLTGNVHRTDAAPTEPVLGFVSAHTVQQKRLFINRTDLPLRNLWDYDTPYRDCTMGEENLAEEKIAAPNTLLFQDPSNVPIDYSPVGYSGSSRACVDCRTRGVNTKPSFW